MTDKFAMQVAVVMQRQPLNNRWQPWRWRPLEVIELGPDAPAAPAEARCLLDSEADTRWLFGGFEVGLFRDEAEGYFLNVDSPTPAWFVMWRQEDGEDLPSPKVVTLSYNEAARMMDGGETVDILPAPPHVVELLRAFVAEHYKPEPKRKRRKPSFEGGAAVEEMARAEGQPTAGGEGA